MDLVMKTSENWKKRGYCLILTSATSYAGNFAQIIEVFEPYFFMCKICIIKLSDCCGIQGL